MKRRELNQELPFEILCTADERINPAILLAEELMRKSIAEVVDFDDLERAGKILDLAKQEINQVAYQFEALTKTPSMASEQIPIGF